MRSSDPILFDAGLFIGALLRDDPRHPKAYPLTARRTHDARHAATALTAGVQQVYTYDVTDWQAFETNGLKVVGPESVLS